MGDIRDLDPKEILEHHGVKGQKWGIRNDHSLSATTTKTSRLRKKASDVTVSQKPGRFATSQGGKRQLASSDAVRAAAARQYVKKSTTDSLTSKQLQEVVQRMNLEVQYHALLKKNDRRSAGQKFISKLMRDKNVQTRAFKSLASAAKLGTKLAPVA